MPLTPAEIRARLVTLLADIDGPVTPPAPPPSSPGVIMVKPSDNLRSLIEQAPSGATFALQPEVRMEGDLTLRKPVTLQGMADPGPARVTATLPAATLRGALVVAAPDVSFVALRLEGRVKDSTILTTGERTWVNRCVVLGSPTGQHRGIAVNSPDVDISGCHIANIWHTLDAQAIAGWSGTKRLHVRDCYLEASGENLQFGGSGLPHADAIPQDLIIQDCHLTKPLSWRNQPDVTCKNLFELKNAKRVQFRRNTCEYSWVSGQVGFGLVLTVRNQGGNSPWSTIEDVLIEDNAFRHLASGVQILGRDNLATSGVMTRVVIRRNRFDDISKVWGEGQRQVQIGGGPRELLIEENDFDGVEPLNSLLTFDNLQFPLVGFTVRGNQFREGNYGIKGAGVDLLGTPVLEAYAPGYLWADNTIVKGPSGRKIPYPAGTSIIPA